MSGHNIKLPTKKIGDVAKVVPGYAFKSKDWCETGLPVIKIRNIVGDGSINIIDTDCVPSTIMNSKIEKFIIKNNDILIAMTGATAGKVGKIRSNKYFLLNQRVAKLIPVDVHPLFFWSVVSSLDYQERFFNLADGAAQPNMSGSQIENVEIPYPPLPTQRKIASILSAYDDLIENNQRRIKILEEMAQSLYREWFVKFRFPGHEKVKFVDSPLGRIPEGWEVKKLGVVCHLTMGQSPKSEFYNQIGEGLPFHQGVTDFGRLFPSDRLFCTVEGRIANQGDILFSVRAPVGRMNISDKRIVIGRGLSAIRHKDNHQSFLWEQLRNKFTEVDMIGNGAIFASVTKSDMQNIELVCPKNALVLQASQNLDQLHQQIAVLTRKITTLRRTRDLLLPKLISGEIDVSDLDIAVPEEVEA